MKKEILNPVKKSTIKLTPYFALLKRVENAIESKPVDYMEIQKVLYEITKPDFKYPELKKCCKNCTAEIANRNIRKAIDKLREISTNDTCEDMMATCETALLIMENA